MRKVVFWDFDGTLVHSEHWWSSNVYEALQCADQNTAITLNEIKECMSSGFTWHTPNEDYSKLTDEKWWKFMNEHIYKSYVRLGVEKEIARHALQKVRPLIKRKKNYHVYGDVQNTLAELNAKGIINAILSNNYPDLKEVVEKLNLLHYFDSVIVSSLEGYDKPRKELFEIAKSRYPNSKYYMIGDSIHADIAGGHTAGMTTVLVHHGYSEEADYCFENVKEILNIFQ